MGPDRNSIQGAWLQGEDVVTRKTLTRSPGLRCWVGRSPAACRLDFKLQAADPEVFCFLGLGGRLEIRYELSNKANKASQ